MQTDFDILHDYQWYHDYFKQVISNNYNETDGERITVGLSLAEKYHEEQKRSDGSPYIVHLIRVALLINKYEDRVSADVIISALLHDVLEDTNISEDIILHALGKTVLSYVKKLTRYRPKNETPKQREEGKINKVQVVMSSVRDIRVVKTFDYLDNMISWKFIAPDKPHFRKIPRWLMEAKTMYIPLAKITNPIACSLMEQELEQYLALGFEIGNWQSDSNVD